MITLGLALPHYDGLLPNPNTAGTDRTLAALACAQKAEAVGIQEVWVSDHLWLELGDGHRRRSPDCWTLLAAIAASTRAIRMGSLVTPTPLREPALLAPQVATVHDLAGPRLDVGLGAGWHSAEFADVGRSFPSARERLASVERMATHLRTVLGPAAPPIWIGGKRAGILAVAARVADGWNLAWDPTPEDYARRLNSLLEMHRKEPGTSTLARSVGLTTVIGTDEDDLRCLWKNLCRWAPGRYLERLGFEKWRSRGLIGTPDEIRAKVAVWGNLGVTHIVCALGIPFGMFDDGQIELLADIALHIES